MLPDTDNQIRVEKNGERRKEAQKAQEVSAQKQTTDYLKQTKLPRNIRS